MKARAICMWVLGLWFGLASLANAGVLSKSAVNVDPGNTKLVGEDFTYVIGYNCASTTTDCPSGVITDDLPPEVEYRGSTAANGTCSYDAGLHRVTCNLDPHNAGDSSDIGITVRFPLGTTLDGTQAVNSAQSSGLFGDNPNSVTVTARANAALTLTKSRLTIPEYLDREVRYRLRLDNSGQLNISGITVTDNLPASANNGAYPVFLGATPAADCEPACQGQKLAQVQWGNLNVNAGSRLDITVRVRYESTDFADGEAVNNEFTAQGTVYGETTPRDFGSGTTSHTLQVFTPNPSITVRKSQGGPIPPAISNGSNGQEYYYSLRPQNNGNVEVYNMVLLDVLPVQFKFNRLTTGRYYTSQVADYATGEGVRVEYTTNLNASWQLLGSSPDVNTNTTLVAPTLGAGEYVTQLRWLFGVVQAGMRPRVSPRIYGEVTNPANDGSPVSPGDYVRNCVQINAEYPQGTALTPRTSCVDFYVADPYVSFNPDKNDVTAAAPYVVGDTIRWQLVAASHLYSSEDLPLKYLVLTDYLPQDLIYAGNYQFDPGNSGAAQPDNFEVILNYKNTGRTLLRWTWSATQTGVLPRNTSFTIEYDTTVRAGANLGDVTNGFGMQHNAPAPLDQRCRRTNVNDVLDFDEDGSSADSICSRTEVATVAAVAELVSTKLVKGTCDVSFTDTSSGNLNGAAFQYKLEIQNTGTVPMEDFVLIDILPFVGDTGVIDTSPRGSQWTPSLVSPILAPPDVTVYYSTSGNPCRGEVGGPTTNCDAPNWSTVPPSPISDVRSFKLEFNGPPADSYDTRELVFNMVAPYDISAGSAYNSFGWRAYRTDLGTPLGAEPKKVEIMQGTCTGSEIGDYVWVDVDGDGTQDEMGTGLNDVQVFLYTPGNDGVPFTFDDVRLASTLTSVGPNGNGWYNFPGLSSGDYYVCLDVPATYALTAAGQGGDPTQDSDFNPQTNCSSVITLGVNEVNPDIDAGLLPTGTASLGNYVWFDRNGDGVQNESPYDGVNGVTVDLYIDVNSNGPDAADIEVASMATDDDVNGIPGYYRFDGLAPGVPYYIEVLAPAVAAGFTTPDQGDDTTDSDVDATGYSPVVTLQANEYNSTLDAGLLLTPGTLSLGNQIWFENDNDGLFEPQTGEVGINGVRLNLYKDLDGDGLAAMNEYVGSTVTYTANGLPGRYLFTGLDAGSYIVVVDLSNFAGNGALAGLATCTGNDVLPGIAPNPDDDVNGDDNGGIIQGLVASEPITLTVGGEPITDGDSDSDTNLSLDFCFTDQSVVVPAFDFGDNPDVLFGAYTNDYRTVALDLGASHKLEAGSSPFLGDCVDADNGTLQDAAAQADDLGTSSITLGSCAPDGDDEDGVSFSTTTLQAGDTFNIDVRVGNASPGSCGVYGWIDWNRNGMFETTEQVANNLSILPGGSQTLTVSVPSTQTPGMVYARFRCVDQGWIFIPPFSADGFGGPGEVEDYRLEVIGYDWGDLPDGYRTLSANNGPRHQVSFTDPLMLGSCVDTENDGQPGGSADQDDGNTGSGSIGLCTDDEDGVQFLGDGTELVACQLNTIQVTANRGGGFLEGWIDFNADGDFNDPGEQVFASEPLNPGVNALQVDVPCNAAKGVTYARFRLSSVGGLPFYGPASDGEVEDYAVTINGFDMGDADAGYPVLLNQDGARHGLSASNPLYLGACVDAEDEGQVSADATGDDNGASLQTVGTCATANDDEDGISFTTEILACGTAQVSVTSNRAGILDAWIDFNADGDWDDANERIFSAQALNGGTQTLSFSVPCDAAAGLTQARFRLSSAGVAAPTGAAPDGEVEDYRINVIGRDWGDLPDTYATTSGASGAWHRVDDTATSPLYLGLCVDTESDGQPPANVGDDALGDDTNLGISTVGVCQNDDDEDGVSFVNGDELFACQSNAIEITVSQNGQLDAWIDFNGDGDFNDAGEQIFANEPVSAGLNTLSVSVPCDGVLDDYTYARFRVSTTGGLSATGGANDGEVEDYRIYVNGFDMGDAPAGYPVTRADTGAAHGVSRSNPLFLGSCVDTENDGQVSTDATGDDGSAGNGGNCQNGADDEDGVTFVGTVMACTTATIEVVSSGTAFLDAWMDVANNGDWADPEDQILTNEPLTAGLNTLTFGVPCNARAGLLNFRFRLSSTQDAVTGPTGMAADGEVEDYQVNVLGADWGDAPNGYGTDSAASGPLHGVDAQNPLYLGSCVDTENDGQPGTGANADDTSAGLSTVGSCTAGDDEDGVSFVNGNELFACQSNAITLVANAAGVLNAWVDFNADGDFNDAGEQIAADVSLAPGSNTLTVQVPCDAAANADTYARFRFSTDTGLIATGVASNGEVEDYQVHINGVDFGDAASSFPVAGTGAARHGVSASYPLYLGACVDTESDGQAGNSANLDDGNVGSSVLGTCQVAGDDEDGVSFTTPVVACLSATVDVTVNLPSGATNAVLDAWFDFNGDGDWNDPNERIFNGELVNAGANNLNFSVPCDAVLGNHHVRFRLSETGVAGAGDAAQYGEVEDYQVYVHLMDMGDLPDVYSTTLASGGPMHLLTASSSLYLGECVDAEINGVPSTQADGDDNTTSATLTLNTCATAGDDEDGVIFPRVLVLNQCRDVTIVASTGGGFLFAWADFNHDNDFNDAGEILASGMSLNAGANTLSVCVPASAQLGDLYTRFRVVSTNSDPSPYGLANDGEVEDHMTLVVNEADLSLVKTLVSIDDADGSNTLSPGDRVRFTLTIHNAGPAPAADIAVEDRLPAGFGSITAISHGGSYDAATHQVSWTGLAVNENTDLALTFEATVLPFAGTTLPNGFYTNTAEIMNVDVPDPDSTPGNGDPNEDDQSSITPTVEPIIDLSVVKRFVLTADNDGSGTETWRDVLTFSIEVTNAGPSTATQVAVRDDLPAGFDNVANISNGGTYDPATRQLSWSGLVIAAGDTLTLTFEAEITLNPDYLNIAQVADANERDLDSTPNNDNATEDDQDGIEVDVKPVIDLSVDKNVLDHGPYKQRTPIRFAVTVSNTGPYAATGVQIVDTMDFVRVDNISHGGQFQNNQIVWNNLTIPAHSSIVLTYTITPLGAGNYSNKVEIMAANEFDLDSEPGNGDATEDDLSLVRLNIEPTPIPSLSQWGLLWLSMLLLWLGVRRVHKRS